MTKRFSKILTVLSLIIVYMGCDFSPDMEFSSSGILGPSDGGGLFELVRWEVTLDSVLVLENRLPIEADVDTHAYNKEYSISLPESSNILNLSFFGKCSLQVEDSTYFASKISLDLRNIYLTDMDASAYLKKVGSRSVIDTSDNGQVISYYSEPIYRFTNPDTTYIIDDSVTVATISPLPSSYISTDTTRNYSYEMKLPAIIRNDTLSLYVAPQAGLIYTGNNYVLSQGVLFTFYF